MAESIDCALFRSIRQSSVVPSASMIRMRAERLQLAESNRVATVSTLTRSLERAVSLNQSTSPELDRLPKTGTSDQRVSAAAAVLFKVAPIEVVSEGSTSFKE